MKSKYSRLDEVADVIDSLHKTPKYDETAPYSMVRATDIKEGILKLDFTYKVTKEIYDEFSKKYKPSVDDTLIVRVGASYGRLSLVKEIGFCLGQNTAAIIPKISKKYVYYVLCSSLIKKQIDTFVAGAAQPTLSLKSIKSLIIPRFGDKNERRIAHILSILDEKIELNRKMNQTLEEMAQTLFKSWFVNFDPVHAKAGCKSDDELEASAKEIGISKEVLELFPSKFMESERGMIPKGWEVKPFSDIAKLDTSSVKPFNLPDTVWKHFSIPSFDSTGYPILGLGSEIKSNKYKVDPNAILSSKLNPHTPRTWLPNVKEGDSAICSTEFMQFIPYSHVSRTYTYLLITSKYFQDAIKSRVTGTTGSRQRAQPKQVAEIEVLHPSKHLIDKLTEIVEPMIGRQFANTEEIQTLQLTRDTLLPKLLSGELDVSTLEVD